MAGRLFTSPRLAATGSSVWNMSRSARSFQTSARQFEQSAVAPVKKPIGAFRGGLFGFLFGVTLAGASAYYYVVDEYKLANDMLTEDIYSLQASVQRLHDHITELENKSAQDPSRK